MHACAQLSAHSYVQARSKYDHMNMTQKIHAVLCKRQGALEFMKIIEWGFWRSRSVRKQKLFITLLHFCLRSFIRHAGRGSTADTFQTIWDTSLPNRNILLRVCVPRNGNLCSQEVQQLVDFGIQCAYILDLLVIEQADMRITQYKVRWHVSVCLALTSTLKAFAWQHPLAGCFLCWLTLDDDAGFLCLWDLADCCCLQTKASTHIRHNIQIGMNNA